MNVELIKIKVKTLENPIFAYVCRFYDGRSRAEVEGINFDMSVCA